MMLRFCYYDKDDKLVAEVTSWEAWYAVKRLFGMPQLPPKGLNTDVEPFKVDVELYGRIRC